MAPSISSVGYFLNIIQWKTSWNKDIFLKKRVMCELRGLFK